MFQGIIVTLIFAGAAFYLGRVVYRAFQARSCTSGCGKCSIDFAAIEKQIQRKG